MIAYGIDILPLVCELRAAHPQVTQPWYAYDAGLEGNFKALQDHMQEIMVRGHLRGYFPDPTKSILAVSPRNVQRMEVHSSGMGVRMVTESCYLGAFIGNPELDKSWID